MFFPFTFIPILMPVPNHIAVTVDILSLVETLTDNEIKYNYLSNSLKKKQS